jgi:two-component system, sensor histidine kinase and response regulator
MNNPLETTPAAPADILLVDDTPANLKVLTELLKEQHYKVRVAINAQLALQAIERKPPDLILLDINMPDMDGYTMAKVLKSKPVHADIPIIFISALDDIDSKIQAFEAGGVDYITKPFHFAEVKARVETHLKIDALKKSLQSQNTALENSLRREKELEGLRDNLVNMMVHDLRSPLTGILGYLSLLEMKSALWDETSQKFLQNAQSSTDKMVSMITQLLDAHRLEAGQMPISREIHCLKAVTQQAIEQLGAHALTFNWIKEWPEGPVEHSFDAILIQRVIANFLGNAVKFSPPGSEICVRVIAPGRVEVQDQGPGIPEQDRERIFEKFAQLTIENPQVRKYSSGLGLSFCQLAIASHHGRIGVSSEPGCGSTFWFEI